MTKSIVVCSDGTGQSADGNHPSNVVHLCTLLDLGDAWKQICCYDAGVGTTPNSAALAYLNDKAPRVKTFNGDEHGLRTGVWPSVTVTAGKLGGYGLKENVKQLYGYLVENYVHGDNIYLFGFSRGAFTVRVLAGLLRRCGLLKNMDLFSQAYERYDRHYESLKDPHERKRVEDDDKEFKRDRAMSSKVKFLGIWDTVKSYGYIWPRSLPHTRHNEIVDTVRHALSIDEGRKFFEPTSWGGLDPDPLDPDGECVKPVEGQNVQEVWFTGDHSDVGGGHPDGNNGLAQISLKWMINEAVNAGKDDGSKLLVDKKKYQTMLAHLSPDRNATQFKRHDLLGEKFWHYLQQAPRKELKNCPPPPKSEWTRKPIGPRNIRKFRRNGTVRLHSSVMQLYCDYEKKARWGSIDPDPKEFAGDVLYSV